MSDGNKPTFSELDRRRRGKRRGGNNGAERRPKGEKAQRRSRAVSAAYRRKVEERLFGKKSDRARIRLEERLRQSHGTQAFHRTFREYVKAVGMPEDVGLLGMLLDLSDERDVLRVVEGIEGQLERISPEQRSLVRSRLRNLEMSTEFDAVADAATDLLEQL